MEDMINALLDVVRAQHSAAEGTDEAPFNMDDIVDMAMNLLGRPDEQEEVDAMVDEIQKTVSSLAPDIFPPKTFEEMDDSEKAMSAANMIENAFMRNNNDDSAPAQEPAQYDYTSYNSYEEDEGENETQDAGDLNDLIYKNFMEMMGLSSPQVEYPFDRSQIRYGKEKSVTEQLAEEEEEKERAAREEAERNRKLSAWELAQNAIDSDEEAHTKEPYVPQPVEQPKGKSASQLAAEAIRKSEEEDRMKLEIEKQAEAMMAEAQRRGQDPMKFMLHQQEILRYMEDNSDELVSFEDYEDLSPEEKLEIERKIHIEKQLADGVDPSEVDENVPEEYIPQELKTQPAPSQETMEEETTFDEDTLRALSAQVLSENSAMFDGESEGDMANFQEELFENLKRMMAGRGTAVPMEDIGSLLAQATANAAGDNEEETVESAEEVTGAADPSEAGESKASTEENSRPLSAVELAMAAQKAMKAEPVEERQTVSAADLAKAAQENAKKNAQAEKTEPDVEIELETESEKETELDMSFDELDDLFEEDSEEMDSVQEEDNQEETEEVDQEDNQEEESVAEEDSEENDIEEASDDDEYEYVDPDELVLGEHTQAEVDEALDNLSSLGLEGEVLERAKRMILLELAGSEVALEAYLMEQENSKKKKKASVSDLDKDDIDDLTDFDEDIFEEELAMAMEEDFGEEEMEEEPELTEEVDETEDEEDDILEVEEPETVEEEEIIIEKEIKEKPKTSKKTKSPHRSSKGRKSVVHKSERNTQKENELPDSEETGKDVEERGYQLSVHKPFVLKNSTSFMDNFESFITESQENRKLSTGFKKLDSMLRFGLHKGSYFIDSQPQYLKNGFMQQIADRAAASGVDVLYLSTELSRYDLMVDSISRLSYEMNNHDPEKAHSVMEILTGENGTTLEVLEDELNWYRGRISEHLFILDQEAVDEFIDSMEEEVSASAILEELIRSIVREGAHKPVVFIDNIENILSVDDSEDMKPFMDGVSRLAKELSIPIVMSYGYMQVENEEDLTEEELEFHESLGNMCDVYLELTYADMITEDSMELTMEDIREMEEDGDSLLIDIQIHRNRRPMRASCQIEGTPKFNYYEE